MFVKEIKAMIKEMENKSFGFTLVELLVVIAILGLLSTIGLMSFRNAQIKGRDAQRKNDLGQIQKAFEMYLSDHQSYPDSLPTSGEAWKDPDQEETVYMKEFPQDPKFGAYGYNSDGSQYIISAILENEQDPQIKQVGYPGCDLCNYAVTSPNYQ